MDQLKDFISHTDKLYDCVNIVLLNLFDGEYLVSHSISGQRSNMSRDAKPKFDERLFSVFMSVIKGKFPDAKKAEITAKIQAVQKRFILKKRM